MLRFLKAGPYAIEITGCWVNILAAGGAHKRHAHPNNFLSGVYYVRTGPGSDAINFHDPRVQTALEGRRQDPVREVAALGHLLGNDETYLSSASSPEAIRHEARSASGTAT